MGKLVSIILPVYNQEDYIRECISSLLDQTYQHLEIIVVNDRCEDASIGIVRSFKDERIRIIDNARNVGLAASVNRAIQQSRGDFLARMDADDIALPQRIEKQVEFLLRHESISILGTAMQSFGHSRYKHVFPETHENCKTRLLFNVCFGHPTVMFRRQVFDDSRSFYDESLQQYSEEYDLWCRVVDRYNFANLPDILLQYRTFQPEKKMAAERKRRQNSFKIRRSYILEQLGYVPEDCFLIHDHIANLNPATDVHEFSRWLDWLTELEALNTRANRFSSLATVNELAYRKMEMYYWNTHLGLSNWIRYHSSGDRMKMSMSQEAKFLFKSVFRK